MRIEQLTFTRFIAASCIVVFHYGKGSFLFNNKYCSFLFEQAYLGVSYFFILSGFVLVIAYQNHNFISFKQFIKNRLARIYPAYILAILITVLVSLFNTNLYDLILNVLMIQSWIPQKALTVNAPGWSLSIELFFYLIFPFFFNEIYRKKSLKNYSIFIVFFWIFSQIIFHLFFYEIIKLPLLNVKDIHYYPILHLNQFLIGNLAGLIFVKKFKNKQNNYLSIIFFIVILILLCLKFPLDFNFHNGLLAILFVPLIIFISLTNDKITTFFSRKMFVFLGEVSFSIYIFQAPIWYLFSDYRMEKYFGFDKVEDFTISFLTRFTILILFASLIYLYFEKPIRNKVRGINK